MAAACASCQTDVWRGLPCWRITLPQGDSVLVAEQGAQVLSWVAGGRERLFLSDGSAADGSTPIRGGVPICWPQFNQRGDLPKHGFARQQGWRPGAFVAADGVAEQRMHLVAHPHTVALWPQAFELTLVLRLAVGHLRLTLEAHNPGPTAWAFSGALHSYLAVDDLAHARLSGLGGQAEWDSLRSVKGQGVPELHIDRPFDRVYDASPGALLLTDGGHGLRIAQSTSWAHTVVWNPGAAMADLPGEGFRRMLCVEAAQVLAPVTVAPGARWVGWQQFDVVAGDAPPG